MTRPDPRTRLVHKGTPAAAGIPIGGTRPADGRSELAVTCGVCALPVPLAVLSVRTVRRRRVRIALLCLAGSTATLATGFWAFTAEAVPDPLGVVLVLAGLILLMVLIEETMTMDDGVRVLERPQRHMLDRPGWQDTGEGVEVEAS